LVRDGRFRSDLFHRLNVVKLSLPPLRNRPADLPSLILAFARRHQSLYAPIETVDAPLLSFLATKLFPGNVRELENAVQRMLFLKTGGDSLGLSDWLAQSGPENAEPDTDLFSDAATAAWKIISLRGVPYAQVLQEIEKRVLQTAVVAYGPTRREIAQRMHTSERTLYYKLKTRGVSGAISSLHDYSA
jgi:DNA-binding NtrC family response regulator